MIKRNKRQCDKCTRMISMSNFKRHYDVCNGPKKTKYPWDEWKIGDNLYKYPDGYIGNMAQVKLHINRLNGIGGEFTDNLKGFREKIKNGEASVWNKGKTAETHPELKDKLKAGGYATSKLVKESGKDFAFTEYTKSARGRKEQSERKKKLYKEFPEKHPNRKLAGNRNKMTYPEKIVFDALTESGITFTHNTRVGNYYPDFLIGKNIIEVDGERWHNAEKDAIRDKNLNELGYTVKRFPVGKGKSTLVERVMKYVNEIINY